MAPSNFFAAALVAMLAGSAAAQTCPLQSICFAMDRSGSMRGFYDREQAFVVSVARTVGERAAAGTTYAAWGFAGSAFLVSARSTDLEGAFVPAVNRPVSPAGATNMYRGLNSCFGALGGTSGSGNRVIVLVTDGQDTETPQAASLAPQIKAAGVSIVTVGIGNDIDQDYLRGLATADDLFASTTFDNLMANAESVASAACRAPTVSPRPDNTPTPAPTPPMLPPPATSFASCQRAYAACGFRFVQHATVPTFGLGPPDRRFTNRIISRTTGELLGVLNTNGIIPQFIRSDDAAFNVTRFATPRFRPTHFKPFNISYALPALNMTAHYSGVGHQRFHGSQWTVAKGRCVRVHFTQFQTLSNGTRPYVVANNVVDRDANKCVVFLTRS